MNKEDIKIKYMDLKVDDTNETLIIALINGDLAASVRLDCIRKRSASAVLLYVVPYLRQKGIGRRLINICCEFATEANCETFGLMVNKNNKTAIEFYEKCGLSFVYAYDDGFILMSKKLNKLKRSKGK